MDRGHAILPDPALELQRLELPLAAVRADADRLVDVVDFHGGGTLPSNTAIACGILAAAAAAVHRLVMPGQDALHWPGGKESGRGWALIPEAARVTSITP